MFLKNSIHGSNRSASKVKIRQLQAGENLGSSTSNTGKPKTGEVSVSVRKHLMYEL